MIRLLFIFFISCLFCLFLWFFLDSFYHLIIFKKIPIKKSPKVLYKGRSIFKQIFVDLPIYLARGIYESDPNQFNEYGIIIFYGPQGSGKTMAMTHYINEVACKFPETKIGTNYKLLIQDFDMINWYPLVDTSLKGKPCIFAFDEISQWFNGRNWQSFPKDLLTEIAYNRKNHRVILGTAQNVCMVDVAIRRQASSGEFRRCFTFFGFIGLVVRFRPEFDVEGNLTKKHYKGFYFYFQNDTLRYLYDTFSTIEEMSKNIEKG